MTLYLSNTLTRKKEEFRSIKDKEVGVYSCGPTVYWNQHVGHMYAFIQWDTMVRYLRFLGYKVTWVINITDVGHLTGENAGNPDIGEDKMEKGAKREGVSVWDIAEKYTKQFLNSLELLNIQRPDILPRATEHIKEQIELAGRIENNGYAYRTEKGLVFDTAKFSDYAKFARIKLGQLKKRKDVQDDPGKKSPWDFFLWAEDPAHIMKWPSPWGEGYPGWHIECTAMSTKYLGENFDIHTGGVEHIAVHHTNEIAQGYGAFGHRTANYWLHNAHLLGEGGVKMSKSLGNFVTVQDLQAQGYDPIAFRYLVLTSHYKKGLNFSFKALEASQVALKNLREQIGAARIQTDRTSLSHEKDMKRRKFTEDFKDAMNDDLNVPKALAVLWAVLKSNIPSEDKYDLALAFDDVLGFSLSNVSEKMIKVPVEIMKLAEKRQELRNQKKFAESDNVRKQIEDLGYSVKDTSDGPLVERVN